MSQLNSLKKCESLGFCLGFLVVALTTIAAAQESGKPSQDERIGKLSDKEVEWDSASFSAGPQLIGENAIAVSKGSVAQTSQLLEKLGDDKSFVVAHVLLTKLWRIPDRSKNRLSVGISDGFFVCYNGLNVRITWNEVNGKLTKNTEILDLACQRIRIRDFWKKRIEEHAEEFSPETVIKN